MQLSRTVWNYWSLQTKNNHVKELNRHFLEWKYVLRHVYFPGTESSGYSWLLISKSRLSLNPAHLLFCVLSFPDNKIIMERTKLLFLGSSVNGNNDVFILVSFIGIAIDSFLSYRLLSNWLMPNQWHARKPVKTNSRVL